MTTNEHEDLGQATAAVIQPEHCQFPGCSRAVPIRPGKGRPARYCGETVLGTEHNRANALTRRRQLERAGVDADRAVTEPVTVARATAGDLMTRLETTVREQGDLQASLVAALRTMDSPEQAAAQAAAATESARADAATARAQAVAAQTRAEQADVQATQALADAEDADADATAAREEAAAAQAETRAAQAELAAMAAQLADLRSNLALQTAAAEQTAEALQQERVLHADTRTQLGEQITTTAEETRRADLAEAERAHLDLELRASKETLTATQATLQSTQEELGAARSAAQTAAAIAAERERTLTAQAVQLTSDLNQARAQIEQLHADVRAADAKAGQETDRAERAESEIRRLRTAVEEAHAERNSALSELGSIHEQLSQLRVDTATEAAITATQLDAARNEAAGMRANLARSEESAQSATARALAAEAQLAAIQARRRD
jgi:colicin import membrane protein